MKVTRIALFLFIVAAPALLFATGTQEKEYTLTYLTPQVGAEPSAEVIEDLVEEWNAANVGKAKVVIEGVPNFANYMEALKTRVAADDGPDFFYYNERLNKTF